MSPTGNRRSKATQPSRQRAFTLVELMLVMTTLIIVISVSLPMLSNFFHGRSLDSEARRLLGLTRYGQSRAVSEGVPMVLWIDAKRGSYGLEAEAGFTDLDSKAVEFPLERDLQIEVINNNNNKLNPLVVANEALRAKRVQSQSLHRNLPMIRFQPDGFIGETGPQALRMQGREGESLFVALSRNRLNYEIRSEFNLQNETGR